ncbi:DUF445 family protein [Neisseriaceae bacterium PsAf]|nr:DUF445 family protein [Neisseriaceae bacterium PsAf]
MNLTENEKQSKARLRQSRFIATSLLILAAIGYVLSIKYADVSPYMIYVKAFCEASMVGGLADWFAVVALFKHPLGLPIPHTAILPKNQERIAKQVGVFIENNFLQPSVIAKKIHDYHPSQLFLNWLSQANNQEKLIMILDHQLSNIINNIKPEWFSQLVLQTAQKKLTGKQLGHYLAMFLDLLKNNDYDEKMFDNTIKQINKWLQDPETRKKIEDSINAWAKKIEANAPPSKWQKFMSIIKGSTADLIDGWLANKIINWADEYCQAISNQPNHFVKEAFHQKWQQLTDNLENSSLVHEKLYVALEQIFNYPTVESFIQDNWEHFQDWFNKDISSNPSRVMTEISKLLNALIEETLNNPERMRKLDIQITLLAKEIVVQYKSTAATYIENRVSEWNSKELVQKLELSVGKDLQYIRVNGTLVGGLVGLTICWITQIVQETGII